MAEDALLRCKICSKKFEKPESLTKHEKYHSYEKKYGCNYCSQKFKFKNSAERHERTHTDEKPFACQYCPKTFSLKFNAKSHERYCNSWCIDFQNYAMFRNSSTRGCYC